MTAANVGVDPKYRIPIQKQQGKISKFVPNAELPTVTETGWDLTLLERTEGRVDDVLNDINYFRTGIHLTPPVDTHFELIASPALYRAGYMIASGVMIVSHESDDEDLVIPLFKFRQGDDLELPFRGVQVLLRKTQKCNFTMERDVEPPKKKYGYESGVAKMAIPSTSTSASTSSKRKESHSNHMW